MRWLLLFNLLAANDEYTRSGKFYGPFYGPRHLGRHLGAPQPMHQGAA